MSGCECKISNNEAQAGRPAPEGVKNMTIEELHKKLKESGVQEDRYYLNGLYGSTNDDDKLALVIKKGIYSIEYETYFKERGEKHSVRIFATEANACQFIYERLKENKEIEDRYSK